MIAFVASIYDELKTQLCDFIKVAGTRIFCTTKCWQAHWKRLSPLQVKFCFKGNHPTSIKPEATPGEQFDVRISGQPEEPNTLKRTSGPREEPETRIQKEAKVFLISSLMKQVLTSPNKSTMINELINNYSHRDSETCALQNGNLERREVSKIEDRVQCQICFKYQRPGETLYL